MNGKRATENMSDKNEPVVVLEDIEESNKRTWNTWMKNDSFMAVASCFAYSAASMSMVFTNKILLTSYAFKFNGFLFLSQTLFTLALILVVKYSGRLQIKNLEYTTIMKWIPVNLIFILMLLSNFFA